MIYRILFLLILNPLVAFSQPDTTGIKDTGAELKEVLVESFPDAMISRLYSAGQPVTIPDSILQTEQSWQQVAVRLPGADFKDFGGNAGLKTVISRGTTSSQNVVLLDGMVMNDGLTGVANLGLLHFSFLNSVTFRSGGYSADAGQGSLGSVLYLESDREVNQHTSVSASTGSFQNHSLNAGLSSNAGSISLKFAGHFSTGKGNFTFPDPASGSAIERLHNDGTSSGLFFSAGSFSGPVHWNSTVSAMNQDQNVPGPVIIGNPFPADAHLTNRDRWWLPVIHTSLAGSPLRISGLLRSNQSMYTDSALPTGKSRWEQEEAAFRFDWLPNAGLSTGMVLRRQQGTASLWKGKPDKLEQNRFSASMFSGFDFDWLFVSSRVEVANELPVLWTGSAGMKTDFQSFQASLSIVRNARYPSFTEIQFQAAGKDLIPEYYTGLEPELLWQSGIWTASVRGFLYRITNKVVGIPQNPVIWSTYNTGSVLGTGGDLSVAFKAEQWKSWAFATFQSIRLENQTESVLNGKQLVYTPTVFGSGGISYTSGNWNYEMTGQFSGQRFTGPENLPWDTLAEFGLLNGRIGYSMVYGFAMVRIHVAVKNITDEAWAFVKSYPMPGRSFQLDLGFSW